MHFQCCMLFVLGGLSPLLKHFKGAVAPLAPLVPPPMSSAVHVLNNTTDFERMKTFTDHM